MLSVGFVPTLAAQASLTESYEGMFYPDLWYNDVDGIRVGVQFEGRVPGSDEEGPHRLDAAVWLGTWLPVNPLSYRVRYTEPIPSISTYGSEGSLQLLSSIREGYQQHGVSFHKRWQQPFNHRDVWEVSVGYHAEQRYNPDYTLFPELWSSEWKGLIRLTADHWQDNRVGNFRFSLSADANILHTPFVSGNLSIIQIIEIREEIKLKTRGYLGVTSRNALPEYRHLVGSGPAINKLENPLTRSRGTIPVAWAESGYLQTAGGANLRGYTRMEMRSLRNGNPELYASVAAWNLELDLPNPVNRLIQRSEILGSLLSFRSYLFSDTGFGPGFTETEPEKLLSSAGAGLALSLSIPDYLGNPRGFVIRYEVPFWLSQPGQEDSVSLRHLIGFGAVITF